MIAPYRTFLIACLMGSLPIAAPVLTGLSPRSALAAVEAAPTAATLAQQARQFYTTGQFAAAAETWQQLAALFQSQGDTLGQAIALSNLSLAYQQLGQLETAATATASSLQFLQGQPPNRSVLAAQAQALNTQGSLQLAQGQAEVALATWQQAEVLYTRIGDATGMSQARVNQAQAMQRLGLYRRALKTLQEVNQIPALAADPPSQATVLQALGNALRLVGDLEESRTVLEQALALAQRLNLTSTLGQIQLSLANTQRAQQDWPAALKTYEQATQTAHPTPRLRALLNQFSLLVETRQELAALALLPAIQTDLRTLPVSQPAVEARLNLARSLIKLEQVDAIAPLLSTAIAQARQLQDPRLESYGLGQLASLYERQGQFQVAQRLTQEALILAQTIQGTDILYQWQWQLGRLRLAQGDRAGAIAAYTQAVASLRSLRSDLVAINPEVQFSFREGVEPLYRQLVSLLLQTPNADQTQLAQARQLIESLQLAELDNFFQEACLLVKSVQIDQVDRQAAVIYPIILGDRLEVILSLPDRSLRHYSTPLSQGQVEQTLRQFRQSFGRLAPAQERQRLSQQVYNWLVRPAKADLERNQVKTLVFVLDGALRDIPMAALSDGQQYLIEQYAVALSPGLQLLPSRLLDKPGLRVLKGGLSEARPGFTALPAVQQELSQIATQMKGKLLLNQELTTRNLKTQLTKNQYNVVHLATHGQFGSSAKDTFILTWDGRINVKQLDSLFRDREQAETAPLELLVLSACQTASGDNRAILGLAGIAIRSGARSTLATLWSVKDQATATFMVEFYKALSQPGITRGEAVRQAQLALLRNPRYQHPVFWAPFVLVGSWL